MENTIKLDEINETYEEAMERIEREYRDSYEDCKKNWDSWDLATQQKKFDEFMFYRNRRRFIKWIESISEPDPDPNQMGSVVEGGNE